ncbi:MAG: alkylmercury lyase, partial [Chloroflexi bacterium]|nr:alkylmercury lyase [Chloroflexota bacterium]
MIADLGVNQDEAGEFLTGVTERDSGDSIVGIFGLLLNDHPHRFSVNGASLTTWCAEDALFLPAMLDQKATVESYSLLSKKKVRLTLGPDGLEEVDPADAVG